MKRLALALALVFACTTTYIYSEGGRITTCQTCCYAPGQCTVTCF